MAPLPEVSEIDVNLFEVINRRNFDVKIAIESQFQSMKF